MHAIDILPDDTETLKRLVLERDAELALRATELAQKAQELAAEPPRILRRQFALSQAGMAASLR